MGTYRDRNDALLKGLLPNDVALRAVAAHQNAEWMTTTTGGRATDRGRGLPDHLRVMTGRKPILLCQYGAVSRAAELLFVDP